MNVQLTDKKIQIFKSTLSLINENGFHGTPMSKIAKHADVAVGSIYHYFPSKEDLIRELYWYCKDKINNHIFIDCKAEIPYEVKFRSVWKLLVEFYLNHVEIFSFMEQFYGSPFYEDIRQNVCKQKAERNKIHNLLEEGIKHNYLKDINIRLILSVYLGVAISLIRGTLYQKSKLNDKEVEELVDIIWNGVKK